MNDQVTINADKLQQLFRENAALRIFVEDLTDPDRHGHLVKRFAPEVFKAALELKNTWTKK